MPRAAGAGMTHLPWEVLGWIWHPAAVGSRRGGFCKWSGEIGVVASFTTYYYVR